MIPTSHDIGCQWAAPAYHTTKRWFHLCMSILLYEAGISRPTAISVRGFFNLHRVAFGVLRGVSGSSRGPGGIVADYQLSRTPNKRVTVLTPQRTPPGQILLWSPSRKDHQNNGHYIKLKISTS